MDASFIRGFYLGCLVLCPSFFRGKTLSFLIWREVFFYCSLGLLFFSFHYSFLSLFVFFFKHAPYISVVVNLLCFVAVLLGFDILMACSKLLLSPAMEGVIYLFIYLFIFHFPLLTLMIEVSCSLFYFVFLSFPSWCMSFDLRLVPKLVLFSGFHFPSNFLVVGMLHSTRNCDLFVC
jgi:hypothetical protein